MAFLSVYTEKKTTLEEYLEEIFGKQKRAIFDGKACKNGGVADGGRTQRTNNITSA